MAHGHVLAGMAAAALAALCFDGAVILQAGEAQAVEPEHGLRLSRLRRLVERPRWVLGTAIGILGWPLQLLAFSWAPVTVVQPTLALGLIVVLVGGSVVLHEPVGAREWAAAAVVVAGVALLAVAGPARTQAVPATGLVVAVFLALGIVVGWPFAIGRRRAGAWSLILSAGCAFAATAIGSKLVTVELAHHRPAVALACAAVTAAFAAIGFLTDMSAMQRFAATRVAPPMFVLETALPVALAPLLFGERWGASAGGGVLIAAGLLLVLAGGASLGAARGRTPHGMLTPGKESLL
jgi:drug/metabolite transporter (DMT)-like permease